MKLIVVVLSALVGSYSLALAQGNPSGPGATTGDPAASSASPGSNQTVGQSNPSGSGTSTSGGKDYNGDQGRDKMPESTVNSSAGKPNSSDPGNKK